VRTQIVGPIADTVAGATCDEVLRACVHCGMCNATCPTYQLTGDELDGPRGRIYLIKQMLEGETVGRVTQDHLDGCLSCRACETTCPSGVEYHRLFDIGRGLVAEKVKRPAHARAFRAAIRAVAAWPERMRSLLSLAHAFRFALPRGLKRKVPSMRTVQAARTSAHARRMTMLGGCVQSACAGHFNAATARVFDKLGVALAETPGVGCCGAVSFHLDAPAEARAFARANIEAWTRDLDAGAEVIVVNSSGCAAFIRDYPDVFADDPAWREKAKRVAEHVRDPVQILETLPLRATRKPARPRIAVHEPCTLQHGLRLPGRIGRLLQTLGYEPQPVADAHLCCGSAGAYSLLHPRTADALRANKLAALTASSPTEILTANVGCWMHLGETSRVPVRHWIEAVDEALG
jgi:glycolate oxidase iron-sulfur subunit